MRYVVSLTETINVSWVLEQEWSSKLQPGGKYYVIRNGTALVAFQIEDGYTPGEPIAIVASHVDSLTLKLKPVSKSEKGGFERLGVAPFSGGGASQSWDASYSTWWDRDLGIGGSVLVKGKDGHIRSRLVSLGRPSTFTYSFCWTNKLSSRNSRTNTIISRSFWCTCFR
jgi:aminopeptidase I